MLKNKMIGAVMFFKKKTNMDVGKISLGNTLYYIFGQDDTHPYTSVYTDKDISVMFYGLYDELTKNTKMYLHCSIKNDKPIFYIEIEGFELIKKAYHINMTLQRFNKLFEEEKLKGNTQS